MPVTIVHRMTSPKRTVPFSAATSHWRYAERERERKKNDKKKNNSTLSIYVIAVNSRPCTKQINGLCIICCEYLSNHSRASCDRKRHHYSKIRFQVPANWSRAQNDDQPIYSLGQHFKSNRSVQLNAVETVWQTMTIWYGHRTGQRERNRESIFRPERKMKMNRQL